MENVIDRRIGRVYYTDCPQIDLTIGNLLLTQNMVVLLEKLHKSHSICTSELRDAPKIKILNNIIVQSFLLINYLLLIIFNENSVLFSIERKQEF